MNWLTNWLRQLWLKYKITSLEIGLRDASEALEWVEDDDVRRIIITRIQNLRSDLAREWRTFNQVSL